MMLDDCYLKLEWQTYIRMDNTNSRVASRLKMILFYHRALFLHVSIPGQAPGADDLESDYPFPTMDAIGLNLVTVLDHLRIKQVVGLGDGAGANIMLRFGIPIIFDVSNIFVEVWDASSHQGPWGCRHQH